MSEGTDAASAASTVGGWAKAGRQAGIAGAAIGVVAAGAAAGVAIERLTVGRGMRRKARLALDASGPYGTLRGAPGRAVADDGTELYFEVDEADAISSEDDPALAPGVAESPERTPESRLRRLFGRRAPDPLTVVFCHGYCLSQDSWHFQRAALRGVVRTVHWDQRSHGRSERGRSQRDGSAPVTIDLLGRDLKAVLDAAVPEGPILLVGHSMGGMTMMALADQYPAFVAERVTGVAFVGTSAGKLGEVSYGLPSVGVKAFHRLAPSVLRVLGAQLELVERGRRATADLFAGLVKRYSFGTPSDVDPAVSRFAERLIESTPIDVVAEFFPAFAEHEKTGALPAFDAVPALVLAGDKDMLTPFEHSEAIAELLPGAELVIVADAGHLVMLERPDLMNDQLAELVARVVAAADALRGSGSGTAGGRARGRAARRSSGG
ncbi:alpha/beta fold hydrolase [Streptomyces sp. H27-D2]|uniref:alpha/beta fold hydrolase n=1 Tax=Streptomyces sp. H27-D2 TaxID=3046304 RepID=UPI002DBD19D3|nr:alpha/beta hydrolase [Streptomyces sp. H27-D2]MEC4017431.1 alpha/beta hydrolase [Streptomyces sp. H27-D2]